MMNLPLNVFQLTEEQEEAFEEGQPVRFEDCDLVEHIFYRIEYIRTFMDGKYCQVNSGGEIFIINAPYHQVKALINERLTFLQN